MGKEEICEDTSDSDVEWDALLWLEELREGRPSGILEIWMFNEGIESVETFRIIDCFE
jgi:hypothetical protein